MTNEPRAGGGLDPEMLAAYIDKRLPPDERAAVEAKLAADPDSYELLVELIHANEALKGETSAEGEAPEPADRVEPQARTGAVVPLVPKPKRTGGWMIAGGVLAVAAALMLVVRLQPDLWQRLSGGDAVDPQLAKLVAAVGEERYIEARLTGGFSHGGLRSVTRGGKHPSEGNVALLAAAAAAQRNAKEEPSAGNLHAWGVAQLLLGRYDEGLATLESAVSLDSSAAPAFADLGAGYATRAQLTARADDWPRALEQSEIAIRLDRSQLEPYFNRALALQALGLKQQAANAWDEYLQRDTTSAWAEEARRRRSQISVVPIASAFDESSGQLCEGNSLDAAHTRFEALTSSWAKQLLDRVQEASDALNEMSLIAACIFERTGDRYPADIVTAIEAPDSRNLAPIILWAVESQELRGLARFEQAYQLARQVRSATSVNHPLWLKVTQSLTSFLYSMGRMSEVETIARSAITASHARSYPTIEAQLRSALGAVYYAGGDFEQSAELHANAATIWRQHHLLEGAAAAAMYSAEALRALGDHEGSWQEYFTSLTLRDWIRQPARRHSSLTSPAVGALNNGLPRVALHFAREAEAEALTAQLDGFICEARYLTARAAAQAGDASGALEQLTEAGVSCSRVSEAGHQQRLLAEMAFVEAEISSTADPTRAVVAAKRALDLFARASTQQRSAALHRILGRAHRQLGQFPEARDALDKGISIVESQEAKFESMALRLSFMDGTWDLYGEKVNLLVAEGRTHDALLAADLSVSRSVAGGAVNVIPELMPAGVVMLIPVVTEHQVSLFAITQNGVSVEVVTVDRAELLAHTRRLVDLLLQRADVAQIDAVGDRISALLLLPFAKEIAKSQLVIVAADPVLQNLPFGLLRLNITAGSRRLLEDVDVVYCPRASRCLESDASTSSGSSSLTLIRLAEHDESVLAGAEQELLQIASLRPDATTVNADLPAFLAALGQSGTVHYAGHAFVDLRWPERSSLLLARRPGEKATRIPFTAFATAVVRADLVVLSACSTIRGRAYRGDGMQAASSILLRRGAKNVLGTLWDVEDAQATGLMVDFHRNLARGLTPSAALRRAQLTAHARGEHPSNWAFGVVVSSAVPMNSGPIAINN